VPVQQHPYPAGLSELEFLDIYERSALRKPQVAADAALRTLVLAGTSDRVTLTALIAQQFVEAARRLVAVHEALGNRREPVALALTRPLPGAAEWRDFAQRAGTLEPEDMLRNLALNETARPSAELLRRQPDLGQFTELIRACETGSEMLLVRESNGSRAPVEFWLAGIGRDGEPAQAAIGTAEDDAAMFADLTADLSSVARGFLGAYLGARRTDGRR
jgi:hypothetical protein